MAQTILALYIKTRKQSVLINSIQLHVFVQTGVPFLKKSAGLPLLIEQLKIIRRIDFIVI